MKNPIKTHFTRAALALTFLLACPSFAIAAVPDLTGAGVIAALKSNPNYSNRPYSETYNLGATGLRGWIYIDGNDAGQQGLITAQSRQILVAVVDAPCSAVLAVDDVILGATADKIGDVLDFSSDCRKAFGVAVGEAEKTGAGTLRVKRWRAGIITEESFPMAILGDYTATAPYNCTKSGNILTNARTKLVSQLLADPNFLSNSYGGAIDALALLASVTPGDANYSQVKTRLQAYAHALAPANLSLTGCSTWDWGYIGIFLSEYYLKSVEDGTPDASVLYGINQYTVALAKAQSRYGTFGQGGSLKKVDGSLHGTVGPYGSMNAAGIPANTAIVMGRKALVSGGQVIDPEIGPAIQRASDFYGYYVNKGPIPYGEHEPYIDGKTSGHASNGKDAMCAVLFGMQENRAVQTEYFSRMTTAGFTGREYGHTGQGFSYLWGSLGANMGGPLAVAEYMKNIRWHLDLARRTDGSFCYDGQEQYGGGKTVDGTYLGASGYYAVRPTSSYLLSYAISLNRLYLTGKKDAGSTNYTLNASQVANAISAATFKQDCVGYNTTQLIAALSDYDPVVRNDAAKESATRTLSAGELTGLITSITNGTLSSNPNTRMGACQALGARKASGALTALGQRLSDTDLWVRAKAANALRSYGSGASPQITPMLTAFVANATDPEVIVWNDPIQIANGFLSNAIIDGSLAPFTIAADKSLLYPAVKACLKQPDSNPRMNAIRFAGNYLTLADAKALTPDLFEAATSEAQADTMWHGEARAAAIENLAKFKMAEAIPIALGMQVVPTGYGWGSDHFRRSALNVLSSYGDAARWTLPALREEAFTLDSTSSLYATLNNTIMNIEAAITSPTGGFNALAVANSQVVVTPVSAPKSITLSGSSCRGTAVTFSDVSTPAHGSLSGTAPNFVYSPDTGYTGPDRFTFKVSDTLTTSEVGTVSLIVGTAGTGLKGEYFDNANFTNLKLTRTDAQVNFDWGTGSPDASIAADTFSVRWSGQLLIPQTGNYTFSTLSSDGVRLFINGVLLIDGFVDQSTIWKDAIPVSLTAGQTVDLQLEYYENTGSAVAKLKWTGPSLGGLSGLPIAKEWLYDGAGIADHTPYALAQSVSLVQNTVQPVVLTGSGVNLSPLTYSIVKKPLHGMLTGTAPNLTYSPTGNYSGSDSFTFLVNNGTSNSSPATVSISIWGTLPSSYFWTNAVTGTWSGSSWTNATGGLVTPAPSGNSSYILNFNQAGTYTATQDLNNNFVFNQLNLAGNVTIDGSSSLSPMANGSLLPQINQNSNSQVTIRAPLNLASMTTLGGSGGGQVDLPVQISGPGGLILNSPGTLKLFGFGPNSPNTYSGGTIVNAGQLQIGAYDDVAGNSPVCINPAGTGPITLNRTGSIQFQRVNMVNALTINGGTFHTPNGYGATCSGPVTMNATPTVDTNGGPLTLSGNINGVGGFNKTGNNTLYLSGTNSCVGASFITAGTLQCNTATALGVGALDITYGAKVNLNFTGTRTIAALTFDGGAAMGPGTYGSSTSPAANQENGYFLGNGTITILPTTSVALSLTAGSTPSNLGSPLTFTAAVAGASPTGNVAFYAGTTLLGTSALNGSFQATFTTSSLAVGSYNIRAKYAGNATNAAASSSTAVAIAITTVFAAPPTNLFAAPGYNPVPLTWTVSTGATSYKVKRGPSSSGPYTTIGTSGVASYNDATAVNGTKYYYVVSAINGAGESANSSPVSVPPFTFNSGKDILSFVFPELPTVNISGTNISVTAPFGTIVTALSPTFTLSTEATAGSISGSTRDFTTPQRYTITAEDQTTKDYTVTVTVNQLPVAIAQTVSVGFNISKPITLNATDGNGDTLAYTIVNQPTNGTLTGTLPDMTYTPTTGYAGTDSFTFKVNDGYVDSVVATVSLIVNPPSFTWNTASAGNWSDDTKWSGGSNPMTSGTDACAINFNVSGSYTATNDLGAGLLINQLNLGGSTLTLAGNKLVFAASGAALPTVNQNSQFPVIIANELNLGVSTTFTGSGNGRVSASGLVTGSGGLTKSGPGTLQVYGIVPNIYSGGTIVNSGTLHLGAIIDGTSQNVSNPLGTGTVTLNTGGTIQFDLVSMSNALTVNGGTLFSPNGWGATWTGPITLNATLNCNTPYRLSCTNTVSGTGGVTKNGSGPLILSGTCSYSGHTTVNGGTLQLDSANTGNNASTVTIAASGATLNLNFAGTDTVNQLFIGTTQMAAGVYKAVGSAAAGTALSKLTGTGTLTVSSGPVATITTLTSNFNPAPPGTSVTFTATVTGSAPTGNVSFYNGATLLATSALNGSFQTVFSTASLGVGSYVITASYAGNANNASSSSAALSQVIMLASFDTWAADPVQKLTSEAARGATADPDNDGIPNLVEFALGGNPMVSSQPIQPSLSKSAGNWEFDYERSDLSLSPATTQVVEYGNNLIGWTPVNIPMTSSGIVTITPGSPSDHVKVTLPTGAIKTFVRLKVSK